MRKALDFAYRREYKYSNPSWPKSYGGKKLRARRLRIISELFNHSVPTDIATLENAHILHLSISVWTAWWGGGPASFLSPQLIGDTFSPYLTFRQCCSQCREWSVFWALLSKLPWSYFAGGHPFSPIALSVWKEENYANFFHDCFLPLFFVYFSGINPLDFFSGHAFTSPMGSHFSFSPPLSTLGNICLRCLVSPRMTDPVSYQFANYETAQP